MCNKTDRENFVGNFVREKSDSMCQKRVRSTSIDDTLQDLILKSDVIIRLFTGQLEIFEDQKVKIERNRIETLDEREAVVQKAIARNF